MTYQPLERRPIAARNTKTAARVATWLARRNCSPNGISVAGMICGILAGISFALTPLVNEVLARVLFLAGALFIQLRLLANLLDGMVAVEAGKASPVGELYNDVPDRISDAATLIGAGYALGGAPAFGYLAACVALLTAYVRAMGRGAGATQEFCGPMAKQQRMFVMTVAAIYCGSAPAAWQPSWGDSGNWGLSAAALLLIIVGGTITAVRRLFRIAAQLRLKNP